MYHIPVLYEKSLDLLVQNPNGVYVDVTFGGGGHSRGILERLSDEGRLIAFDQDYDARKNIEEDSRLAFIPSNFRYLKNWIEYLNVGLVDGVIADLGVSSYQFDKIERGFSYRGDALLDMRMNQESEFTAKDVLNRYDGASLQEMFSRYGEIRNSRQLAEEIVARRKAKPISTISDFLNIVEAVVRGKKMQYLSQVFQAIRIEVNDEMMALSEMLKATAQIVKKDGVLVVMSYHSGEDKPVKNFFKSGNVDGVIERSVKGENLKPFKEIKESPISPDEIEIKENVRARSAKMRVGIRI